MKAIQLARHANSSEVLRKHGWPLKVVATGQEGAPSDIFVYNRARPGDTLGDVFQCVASVAQLDEIPTSAPTVVDATTQVPFYRTNTATFVCRSAAEAESVWKTINEDTQDLLRNLEAAETLVTNLTVVVTSDDIRAV